MNKVYAVWAYNYEDSNIKKMCSTREKAEAYMIENGYDKPSNSEFEIEYGIEEYEVD